MPDEFQIGDGDSYESFAFNSEEMISELTETKQNDELSEDILEESHQVLMKAPTAKIQVMRIVHL